MRVILIDNDSVTSAAATHILAEAGIGVDLSKTYEDAAALAGWNAYDLILVGIEIPSARQANVLRDLQRARRRTPIFVFSKQCGKRWRIEAFQAGADDVMSYPFDAQELVARIRAVVRRSRGHSMSAITSGNLQVNLETKVAKVCETPVYLTKKEYQLLELLCLRKGEVMSRQSIIQLLYDDENAPGPKIIDVFVSKLRKKLSEVSPGEDFIDNVRGRGYVVGGPAQAAELLRAA